MKSLRLTWYSLTSLVTALALILSGAGCARTTDEPARPNTDEIASPLTYEQMGQAHNDGLTYLAEHGATRDDDAGNTRLLQDFWAARGEKVPEIDYAGVRAFHDRYFSGEPAAAIGLLHDDRVITDRQRPVLEALVTNVEQLFAQGASAAEVGAYIASLEAQVNTSRELTAQERDGLLRVLTIARYSAAHWESNGLPEDELSTLGLSAACKRCLRRNWWAFALFDGLAALQAAVAGPAVAVTAAIIASFVAAGVTCSACF